MCTIRYSDIREVAAKLIEFASVSAESLPEGLPADEQALVLQHRRAKPELWLTNRGIELKPDLPPPAALPDATN